MPIGIEENDVLFAPDDYTTSLLFSTVEGSIHARGIIILRLGRGDNTIPTRGIAHLAERA